MFLNRLFLALFFSLAILRGDSFAEDPVVSEKAKDQVFEYYVGSLDNSQRIHQLGFQATMICDVDAEVRNQPVPNHFRRYGIIADVGDGKFRRIENVGWFIGDAGVSWEQGARLICNDSGAYIQADPSAIREIKKVEVKPGISIHTQTIYSPFGLFWTNILGAGEGEATPSAMTILESEMKLIDASFNDPKIECLYLANNHIAALSITFDKNQGKMPVEVRRLYRDRKFAGADKLKPLTNIDPKEVSRWLVVGVAKVYWTKITSTRNEEFWVPSIIDMKEQDLNFKERIVYYFADWKIGRDVDMAIFDHKKFEKKKPNTIYAEVELSHEYIARQKELDEKALALRKKFKLE